MAASLLFPCLLFAYASLLDYRRTAELAEERITRSLDVEQEQALNAFELVNLTLDDATNLVAGMSASDIAAKEEQLHELFKKLADAVTAVQSIWIYGKDGRRVGYVNHSSAAAGSELFRSRLFHSAAEC